MLDPHDTDHPVVGNQAIDDARRATASRAVAGELALERLADPLGFIAERAHHELDDRSRDTLREPGERAFR